MGEGTHYKRRIEMPVLLFPHSRMSASLLRAVIGLLGPIRTYLPWFSEPPEFTRELSMEIKNPPLELKPKESFRAILSEYRLWAEWNRDRSYLETVKADRMGEGEESNTWEIRRKINSAVESAGDRKEEETLRWHLLITLARDFEEQSAAVDEIMNSMKQRDSLLKGSVEKAGDMKDLLGDLSTPDQQSLLGDMNPGLIMSAWLGLFGGYLEGNEILITLNPHLMDHLSVIWEDPAITFTLPDMSQFPGNKQDKLRTLISGIDEDPGKNLEELERLSGELPRGRLKIQVKYLYPIPEKSLFERNRALEKLSRKTVILAEEVQGHGSARQ